MKKLLQEFSSRLSTPPSNLDPKEIQKAPVFPVRYPDGQRKLCDASVDFAIVDQQRLHDEFASKAAFFDFSLEETHQLKPFLDWVGFRSRYLSDLVTDITSVAGQQTRPVSDPTRRLNTKARALLRQV